VETDMTDDLPRGVIPHLVVSDAAAALEFYKRGLGALETSRMTAQDGKRLLHAEMEVNGARVFIRDEFPEHGQGRAGGRIAAPSELGGTAVTLHLEVPDCDEAIRRAAEAGATVVMPPMDAFWGARYGQVVDPYGHSWSFAHPLPAKPPAA
jgi:PhnB protein